MIFILATLVLSIFVYFLFGHPVFFKHKPVNPYKELKVESELSYEYIETLIQKANLKQLNWVLAYLMKNDKTINLYLYDRLKLINKTKQKQKQLSALHSLGNTLQTNQKSKLG